MTTQDGRKYFEAQEQGLQAIYLAIEAAEDEGGHLDPAELEDQDLKDIHAAAVSQLGMDPTEILDADELRTHLDEMPLSVDVEKVHTVLLTFGGPNAYVDVKTRDGVITGMVYHFAWGDKRYEKYLHEDDALGRFAAEQVETMIECGY